MGNCAVFDRVIAKADNIFSYLVVDLPGHGKTKIIGKEELYNMHNTAQALIELLNSLTIKKCFLVGYSMGGRLALYLTLNFPQYFSKVILESVSPGLKTERERNIRRDRDFKLAKDLESIDFFLFLERWYSNSLFLSLKQHPQFSKILATRLENNPQELAKSLRNLSTGLQPSLWNKLPENRIAILLLAGELDKKFVTINSQMSNLSRHINLKIIKGCGHNIHFENPQEFTYIMKSFFT